MKERPILFSAPMVRALLAGTKTQTRRIVKPQPTKLIAGLSCIPVHIHPDDWAWSLGAPGCSVVSCKPNGPDGWALENSPYGQPGDRLWVREAVWRDSHKGTLLLGARERVEYDADLGSLDRDELRGTTYRLRPSIHMPRSASRLTLEITGVRVERLQSISEADAIAEGLEWYDDESRPDRDSGWQCYPIPKPGEVGLSTDDARFAYRTLWESINGPGSWDANPWVWVIEFRRAP